MAGNRLGSRGRYQYTDDGGDNYTITTDVDLATAAGLAAAVPGDPPLPKRFKVRKLFIESANAPVARKALTIGTVDSTLYAANSSQVVTVDGETFNSTGRRGEKASF